MSAAALLVSLHALGFVFTAVDGRIHVSPWSRLSEDQRAAIRDRKAEPLALLQQEHANDMTEYVNERAAVLKVDHQLSRAAA
ncbi:hypothetical protein [Methylococcus mesophilus]|uniref:hypothetical protein n=1 Tax=Methylococcus mesophilus TaxID=2993564 RepID=UPI00224B111C|nr:hypothetical protein [Methylococcus mesophilus]UZR29778.1 hypothetical protein OOT43_03835 [Methylococcus mesophilus]